MGKLDGKVDAVFADMDMPHIRALRSSSSTMTRSSTKSAMASPTLKPGGR
jgi:hypothetical protein